MDEERRHLHLLEIFGLVRLGERLDAIVGGRETGHHSLKPERLSHTFRNLHTRPVVAIEGYAEIFPELRAIGQDFGAEFVEDLDRQAAWVVRRLQHERRDRPDEDGLGDPFRAVSADIAGYFPTARRVADMDHVLQVELADERLEILRVGVEIVAGPGLARAAMAPA